MRKESWWGPLYIRKSFDCTELKDSDEKVECLWVTIRGKAEKADILVGVCYGPPNRDEEVDELFYDVMVMFHDCQPLFLWVILTCQISAGNSTPEKRFLECVKIISQHSWEGSLPGKLLC